EIRLHRAATSSASAALVVDHLAQRLRLSALGS
ncbi:MAG: LysR family transcriptional regulator, partial [Mesorhizobium sp.]